VVIKSKSTLPVWFAKDIVENLKQKGVYVKRSRVFVIYGSDRLNPGLRSDVVGWLSRHGIQADIIDPTTLKDQLLTGLIDRMQEAAAFVAICTPDDAVFEDGSSRKPSYSQPRQNVLLEIGMVLGLPRGVNRLIALQAWGNTVEEQARFPSDLSGLLTLRVENGQVDWDGFQKSLLLRGVALQP
jgi:predicted nucleotide-binding protein